VFILDENNKPSGILGIMEDISMGAGGYGGIFRNINTGVYVSSLESPYFIQFNPAVYKMFGYSEEELRRIPVEDLYQDPDDRTKLFEMLKEKGEVKNVILKMKEKNGTPMLCSCSATLEHNELSRTDLIKGTLEDVTEKQRALNLLLSQYHIGQVLSSAEDFDTTLQGILNVVCEKTEEIDSGAIYVIGENGNLELKAHNGTDVTFLEKIKSFPPGSPLTKLTMAGRIEYSTSSDKVNEDVDQVREMGGFKGIILVPLVYGGDVIGLFALASRDQII